jgi:TPR repeat protein
VKWPQSGQTSAQARLGSTYALGKSVTRNYTEAVKWRTKAAEQGEAPAQPLLGLMYEQGRGVTQDYVLANVAELGAVHGFEDAKSVVIFCRPK